MHDLGGAGVGRGRGAGVGVAPQPGVPFSQASLVHVMTLLDLPAVHAMASSTSPDPA